MNTTMAPTTEQITTNSFISKVYSWMFGGLVLTGAVATTIASNQTLTKQIIGNNTILLPAIILQLVAVIVLSWCIKKISTTAAKAIFLGYSALTGVTLSTLFLIYTQSSLAGAFFLTGGIFGMMSIYGHITKTDLTSIGNICFMGILGLILSSIVNIWLHNTTLSFITNCVGVLIFTALIAYDTQKIKNIYIDNEDQREKAAILGALALYLDFINLFLQLLRLFGRRN